MLFRVLIAALAMATLATVADAGPFRRNARPVYRPVYQSSAFTPTVVLPASGIVASPSPVTTTAVQAVSGSATVVQASATVVDGDGLDEVNAKRAMRGLRPFVRDEGLTQAARACAQFRANHGLFGHTANDFSFVPAGTVATAAGCAAYPASYGWMSCCVYDHATYAGAAYVTGRDGRRYMHLFVR